MQPYSGLVALSVITCSRDCRQIAVCDHHLTVVMEYAAFSGLHNSKDNAALYKRPAAVSVPRCRNVQP